MSRERHENRIMKATDDSKARCSIQSTDFWEWVGRGGQAFGSGWVVAGGSGEWSGRVESNTLGCQTLAHGGPITGVV